MVPGDRICRAALTGRAGRGVTELPMRPRRPLRPACGLCGPNSVKFSWHSQEHGVNGQTCSRPEPRRAPVGVALTAQRRESGQDHRICRPTYRTTPRTACHGRLHWPIPGPGSRFCGPNGVGVAVMGTAQQIGQGFDGDCGPVTLGRDDQRRRGNLTGDQCDLVVAIPPGPARCTVGRRSVRATARAGVEHVGGPPCRLGCSVLHDLGRQTVNGQRSYR